MAILDHFSGTPRRLQVDVLKQIEKLWHSHDVFVIRAPVSAGKSRVSMALAAWAGRQGKTSAVLTSNNLLTKQYTDEFTHVPGLYGRSHYPDPAAAREAREAAAAASCVVTNYWCYQAHRMQRDVVVFDEAHNLLPMLTSTAVVELPQSEYGWPDSIETAADLLAWLETLAPIERTQLAAKEGVQQAIKTKGTWHVVSKQQLIHDKVIRLQMLDARHIQHKLFSEWGKLVLMSATIGPVDIYDLGLDKRRVVYIDCDSPIPAVNRPFIVRGTHQMRWGDDVAIEAMAVQLEDIFAAEPKSGVVHCTYAMAARLREKLQPNPRIIWHTNKNKKAQYELFRQTPGSILVASGMYEGIDLPGDLARWQAICKIPFPNLTEPAVAARLSTRPDTYAWAAIRDVLQAYGRVCRHPTDTGKTYMLDAAWNRIAHNNRKMLPVWFRSAVKG